jgi:hypothetical protein
MPRQASCVCRRSVLFFGCLTFPPLPTYGRSYSLIATQPPIASGWCRVMGANAQFVSFFITEIRSVVAVVILGPKSWRPFADRTPRQCPAINKIDHFCRGGKQGHHRAVAGMRRRDVVRPSDNEEGSRRRWRTPCRPRSGRITKLQLQVQLCQDGRIEIERPGEVVHADEYM